MKRNITRCLNSPLDPENGYKDKKLIDVIASLQSLLDSVDVELRDKVKFKLYQGGDSYDGYHCVDHEIYYESEETDDEYEFRIKQEKIFKENQKRNDLRKLKELKMKYEAEN